MNRVTDFVVKSTLEKYVNLIAKSNNIFMYSKSMLLCYVIGLEPRAWKKNEFLRIFDENSLR